MGRREGKMERGMKGDGREEGRKGRRMDGGREEWDQGGRERRGGIGEGEKARGNEEYAHAKLLLVTTVVH